ncbi:hypothetical protein WAI453_012730 [Rhynchosporium graminicola]
MLAVPIEGKPLVELAEDNIARGGDEMPLGRFLELYPGLGSDGLDGLGWVLLRVLVVRGGPGLFGFVWFCRGLLEYGDEVDV